MEQGLNAINYHTFDDPYDGVETYVWDRDYQSGDVTDWVNVVDQKWWHKDDPDCEGVNITVIAEGEGWKSLRKHLLQYNIDKNRKVLTPREALEIIYELAGQKINDLAAHLTDVRRECQASRIVGYMLEVHKYDEQWNETC